MATMESNTPVNNPQDTVIMNMKGIKNTSAAKKDVPLESNGLNGVAAPKGCSS